MRSLTSRPRKGGGRVLYDIDLLEISITSKPMHAATRVLSSKDGERLEHTARTRPIEVVSFEC
jgi:hypothetical protein